MNTVAKENIAENGAVEETVKIVVVVEEVTTRRLAKTTKDSLLKLARNLSREVEVNIVVDNAVTDRIEETDRREVEVVSEAAIVVLATVPEVVDRRKKERPSLCKHQSEENWV